MATSARQAAGVASSVPLFDSADAVKLWLSERFAGESDPATILTVVCETLGRHLGISRVGYGEVSGDELVVLHDWTDGLASIVGRRTLHRDAALVRDYERGRTIAVADVATLDLSAGERASLRKTRCRATLSVPLVHDGRFVALFSANHHERRAWREDEIALVSHIAARTWAALEQARTLSRLRESEEQFRLLADNMPGICWLADPDGKHYWINRAGRAYYGGVVEDPMDTIHPDDRNKSLDLHAASRRDGRTVEATVRMRGPDGQYRPMLTRIVPIRDASGSISRWCGLQFDLSEQETRTRHDVFLRAVSDAIRDETDSATILATVADRLRTHLGVMRVFYSEANSVSEGPMFDIRRDIGDLASSRGNLHAFPPAFDDLFAAYVSGKTIVCDDFSVLGGPINAELRDFMATVDVRSAFAVPLVKAGRLDGVLVLLDNVPRHWTDDEITLVEALAERTWATLTRARAEEALKAREREQAFLIEWTDRVRTSADPGMIMNVTLAMLGSHFRAFRATYSTIEINSTGPTDGGEFTVVAEWHAPGEPALRGHWAPTTTISEPDRRAYLAGETLVSDDLSQDARFSAEALRRFADTRVAARIAVPLARNGVVQAILSIEQDRPRQWLPSESALAAEVADRMWGMLERARTQAELTARERDQAFVIAWSDELRIETDPEAIISATLAGLAIHLGVARANFCEPDERGGFIVLQEWCDTLGETAAAPRPAVSDGVENIYLAGETAMADDVNTDPRFDANARRRYRAVDAVSFAAVPMVRGGVTHGLLSVQHRDAREWSDREVRLLREIADRLWTTLERVRAEASLLDRERNQAFLVEWSDSLRQLTTADQAMAITLEQLTRHLGANRTTYSVNTRSEGEFVVVANWCDGVDSVVGRRFSVTKVSQAIVDHWEAGEIVRYDDVVGDPRILPGREAWYDDIAVRAFITVPLIVEGEIRASISVQSKTPRKWRNAEIQLIRDVSERLWIVLDRARALAELRQRERDQAFLIGWSDLARKEAGAKAILQMTVERIGRYLGISRANYLETDDENGLLNIAHEWTQDGIMMLLGRRFPLSMLGSPLASDHLSGAAIAVDDVANDPRCSPEILSFFEGLNIAAFISVSLVREGRIVAILALQQAEPRTWRNSETRLLREIADRTWATLERARSEERLNESEAQLSAFMENAPVAMHLKDGEGRYIRVNPELARATGWTPDEMIGLKADDVFSPALARDVARLEARARAGETASAELVTGLPESYASVLTMSFPVPGDDARTGGFTIDLTERKRTEEALARSREALYQTEKLTALGSLLAGVSHELNNPLSIVVAQAVMMERQAKGGELAERAFKIRKAADRCARIVQTFLAMARAKQPERQAVELNQVAMAALDLAEFGLTTEGIRVERVFAPDLPQIAADADQLHQIIVNLVINAQHALAGREGERVLTISTARGPQPMTVVLDVADNGPGVPAESRRRIFEPFFTTKPQNEGTGIGLSFSQGLAEAHGGRLTLLPTARGATFRLTLPVDPQQTLERVEPEAEDVPPPPARRALVIDDEREIAESLADFLSIEGYECDIAIGGVAAKSRLMDGAYDLVVSDLRMPDVDGAALYDFVQAERPDLLNCMAFATGDTLGSAAARFLAETQRPVLEKPFMPDAVRRFLDQMEPR